MTTDRQGRTPLHYAAGENDVEEVRAHLAAGVDVDARDDQDVTPLHFAAQHGASAAVRALVEAGADLNAVNNWGNTPLVVGLMSPKGSPDVLRYLVEKGTDPTIENTSGRSLLYALSILAPNPKTEAVADALAARDQ